MSTTPTFNFLLNQYPYLSRVGKQIEDAKNYYAVAFKPGYALQASELNEMQELQYIQQTLTQTMISNWCTQAIINDATGTPTTGPGWDGCTPLHPDLITLEDETLNIKAGWYLFKNTETFGVWAYNKTPIQHTLSSISTQYGFYAEHSIVECTNAAAAGIGTDRSLQDTSNINVINGNCGASRLKLSINTFGASGQPPSQGLFYSVLSGDSTTMNYINNLRVGS